MTSKYPKHLRLAEGNLLPDFYKIYEDKYCQVGEMYFFRSISCALAVFYDGGSYLVRANNVLDALSEIELKMKTNAA